jgi:hypothetical protein
MPPYPIFINVGIMKKNGIYGIGLRGSFPIAKIGGLNVK